MHLSRLQAVYSNKITKMCQPCFDLVKMKSGHIDDVMTLMITSCRLEDCHKLLLYGFFELYPGGCGEEDTTQYVKCASLPSFNLNYHKLQHWLTTTDIIWRIPAESSKQGFSNLTASRFHLVTQTSRWYVLRRVVYRTSGLLRSGDWHICVWCLCHSRPGPCLTTATWRCRKNFSQWERSFHWKLHCHWLEFLRQRQIALVRQDPGPRNSSVLHLQRHSER